MADFKNLLVWQKAHALAILAHTTAAKIRGAQNAALRSQITRSAQSIAANIVEGRGQRSKREFARYLGYSINSASSSSTTRWRPVTPEPCRQRMPKPCSRASSKSGRCSTASAPASNAKRPPLAARPPS